MPKRGVPNQLLALSAKCCYAQFMVKQISALLLSLAISAGSSIAALAASEPCNDCKASPELTIREQIKADRAREADRVARETSDRPWDGKDLGGVKRANDSGAVR
jgi:hypothetical protein